MLKSCDANPKGFEPLPPLFSGFDSISKILTSELLVQALIADDVEELMVVLLKLAEGLDMSGSIKYTSVNALIKFLMRNPEFHTCKLNMIILICLRTGIKLHDGQAAAQNYSLETLMMLCGVVEPQSSYINLETQFLIQIGFELSIETPFTLLQDLHNQFSIPVPFLDVLSSVIDFSLSIFSLAALEPQRLFGGCLLASDYGNFLEEHRELKQYIRQLKGGDCVFEEVYEEIVRKFKKVLSESSDQEQKIPFSI